MNIIYNYFRQYLSAIHLEPNFPLEDTSISFTKNDLNYIFETDARDSAFFRIVLPNIDDYSPEKDKRISEFSSQFKVAKLEVVNNQICIVAEQFVYCSSSNGSWFALFDRIVELLNQVINEYRENFQR